MAATTKLIVYNEVLRELGSTFRLANLVTPGPALTALEGAFAHAVEYVISRVDWNFARRRASLTSTADGAFPPFTRRYTKPADYLRKVWIKLAAADAFQIEHAEVGAVFYGYETTALMEYMSDDASNADPANWPPQFTRCMVLYLAQLVGPSLARANMQSVAFDAERLDAALAEARASEDVFAINVQVPAARLPVMRRAIEILGEQMSSSVMTQSFIDRARWKMQAGWDHTIRSCLEAGAWNFATRRALLTGGTVPIPRANDTGYIEGIFVGPAVSSEAEDISEFQYGYNLPPEFLHKISVKRNAYDDRECRYQFLRSIIMADCEPVVLEFVASDNHSTDPESWPATFTDYVASALAKLAVSELGLKPNEMAEARAAIEAMTERRLSDAKTKDAIQQAPAYAPLGAFALARRGNARGYRR